MTTVKFNEDGTLLEISGKQVTAESYPEIYAQIKHRIGPDEAAIIVGAEELEKALGECQQPKPVCGECHLQEGEVCDICGAKHQ